MPGNLLSIKYPEFRDHSVLKIAVKIDKKKTDFASLESIPNIIS